MNESFMKTLPPVPFLTSLPKEKGMTKIAPVAGFEESGRERKKASAELRKMARATDPGWTPLFVNAAGIVRILTP